MMLAEKGVLAQAVLLPHPPDVVVGPAPAEQAVLEAEGDQLRVEGRLLRPTSGGVNAPSGGRARGSVAMISEKRWPRGDGRWGRVGARPLRRRRSPLPSRPTPALHRRCRYAGRPAGGGALAPPSRAPQWRCVCTRTGRLSVSVTWHGEWSVIVAPMHAAGRLDSSPGTIDSPSGLR